MTAPPAPEETTAVDACGEQLRQRFPALFGGPPKPIKLHIQADIRQRAPGVFPKAALTAFLRRYTGRNAYLAVLTRSAERFDLDGAPAGEVSAEHRQAAADELARRRTLREQREAMLEQQRRQRAELLRAFDTTTLTPANFCALKGLQPEQLEPLLELARREAAERGREPRPSPPAWPRRGGRPR